MAFTDDLISDGILFNSPSAPAVQVTVPEVCGDVVVVVVFGGAVLVVGLVVDEMGLAVTV